MLRRRVQHVDEAQDLLQEFFARLLEQNLIGKADPQRGRFRAFLLTSLRNFLVNEWAKSQSVRRGKGRSPVSLDLPSGEARFVAEPVDTLTPEKLFERRWAETLLDRVTEQLRQEHVRAGKAEHFEQLAPFLVGRNQDVLLRHRCRSGWGFPRELHRSRDFACAAGFATCCGPRSPRPWRIRSRSRTKSTSFLPLWDRSAPSHWIGYSGVCRARRFFRAARVTRRYQWKCYAL